MPRKELIIPVSSISVIHEYVLIRKFIHMGSIISIISIFWVFGLALEIKYAMGYAITRHITVARKAKQTERINISR